MAANGLSSGFIFDAAMRRLTYLMGFGCLVVTLYGGSLDLRPVQTVCIGLMIALASTLGAGLVGFIFGVPFSRDSPSATSKSAEESQQSESRGISSTYRPNTSLEQISDWLTKILVGVGLVEIKEAPDSLARLVSFLAPGIGAQPTSKPLIVSILVFFGVCGFLFGFLWARLYLKRWLTDADKESIETAIKKLSIYDTDATAYSLVARQIGRREDEDSVPELELQKAIKTASSLAKAKIFEDARLASDDMDAKNYQSIKNPAAISIFKALIAADPQAMFHRNHAELGYALDRRLPPDFDGAIAALSEAIARRNSLRKKGWLYYEFRRARNRIRQDANYASNMRSEEPVLSSIVADLRAAKIDDSAKFDRWLRENPDVSKWLQLNEVKI